MTATGDRAEPRTVGRGSTWALTQHELGRAGFRPVRRTQLTSVAVKADDEHQEPRQGRSTGGRVAPPASRHRFLPGVLGVVRGPCCDRPVSLACRIFLPLRRSDGHDGTPASMAAPGRARVGARQRPPLVSRPGAPRGWATDFGDHAPERILVGHEIVNDDLGGLPIMVSYCPLCNSAIVFDRRVGHRTLTFGTTGKLRDSDLVMWDCQTQSWWQQFTGTALVGRYTGATLRPLEPGAELVLVQGELSARHGALPGHGLPASLRVAPYAGYDAAPAAQPPFYIGRVDPRLPPLERVVAVFADHRALVVPFSALVRRPVIAGSLAGHPLVVLYAPGVVSALDAGKIAELAMSGRPARLTPSPGGGHCASRPRVTASFAIRQARPGASPVLPSPGHCAGRSCAPSATTSSSGSRSPRFCPRPGC